jgi:casein kinase 1
MMISV